MWVGDARTPEGRAVRRALRMTEHPALVVLAHGEMAAAAGMGGGFGGGMGGGGGVHDAAPPVQALGAVQGVRALQPEGCVASLAALLERCAPLRDRRIPVAAAALQSPLLRPSRRCTTPATALSASISVNLFAVLTPGPSSLPPTPGPSSLAPRPWPLAPGRSPLAARSQPFRAVL